MSMGRELAGKELNEAGDTSLKANPLLEVPMREEGSQEVQIDMYKIH